MWATYQNRCQSNTYLSVLAISRRACKHIPQIDRPMEMIHHNLLITIVEIKTTHVNHMKNEPFSPMQVLFAHVLKPIDGAIVTKFNQNSAERLTKSGESRFHTHFEA